MSSLKLIINVVHCKNETEYTLANYGFTMYFGDILRFSRFSDSCFMEYYYDHSYIFFNKFKEICNIKYVFINR